MKNFWKSSVVVVVQKKIGGIAAAILSGVGREGRNGGEICAFLCPTSQPCSNWNRVTRVFPRLPFDGWRRI